MTNRIVLLAIPAAVLLLAGTPAWADPDMRFAGAPALAGKSLSQLKVCGGFKLPHEQRKFALYFSVSEKAAKKLLADRKCDVAGSYAGARGEAQLRRDYPGMTIFRVVSDKLVR